MKIDPYCLFALPAILKTGHGLIVIIFFPDIWVNNGSMQYMIIEKFRPGKVREMYLRFADKGRMLPDGVTYINSWINESVTVCYQIMEAESMESLQLWIDNWKDLVDFEIIQVISSAEAKDKVFAEPREEW